MENLLSDPDNYDFRPIPNSMLDNLSAGAYDALDQNPWQAGAERKWEMMKSLHRGCTNYTAENYDVLAGINNHECEFESEQEQDSETDLNTNNETEEDSNQNQNTNNETEEDSNQDQNTNNETEEDFDKESTTKLIEDTEGSKTIVLGLIIGTLMIFIFIFTLIIKRK